MIQSIYLVSFSKVCGFTYLVEAESTTENTRPQITDTTQGAVSSPDSSCWVYEKSSSRDLPASLSSCSPTCS